jgi:hypothetical protein
MRRTLLFALALFVTAAIAPAAEAQLTVQRSVLTPPDAGPATAAEREAASERVGAIFAAQRRYFAEHGRFAPNLGALIEINELPGPSRVLAYAAGKDWYVVLAGSLETGLIQNVVSINAAAAPTGLVVDDR